MAARKKRRKPAARRRKRPAAYCVMEKGRKGSLTFTCNIRTKKAAESKARSARRAGKTVRIVADKAARR